MTGFGLTVFGLALLGAALFAHRQQQKWFGLVIAFGAGLVLALSALSGWLATRGPLVSAVAFVVFLCGIAAVKKDLEDRSPDRLAMVAMAAMPMLLFAAAAALPMIGSSLVGGYNATVAVISAQLSRIG
jgi:uncharacterized membrane protein